MLEPVTGSAQSAQPAPPLPGADHEPFIYVRPQARGGNSASPPRPSPRTQITPLPRKETGTRPSHLSAILFAQLLGIEDQAQGNRSLSSPSPALFLQKQGFNAYAATQRTISPGDNGRAINSLDGPEFVPVNFFV